MHFNNPKKSAVLTGSACYIYGTSIRVAKSSRVQHSVHTSSPCCLQIADLGSARSATAEGYHFVEQQAPDQLARRSAGRGAILSAAAPAGFGGQRHFRLQDLYVQLGARGVQGT